MDAENISKLSLEDARKVAATHGKFKARSHDTYPNEHLPELEKRKDEKIDIVLIGDSMLERLKRTGASTKIAQLPSTFNAGVGGDKIENVLYRLGTLNMMSKLEFHSVKLVVVMVGTNNLKKALKPKEVELYRLLLRVLLRITPPASKNIACELFKRKDIDDTHVDGSNR